MNTFLYRFIPRQPGYPVEVGIVTGKVGEAMGLHDSDNQGVTGEELEPASSRPGIPPPLRGPGQRSSRLPVPTRHPRRCDGDLQSYLSTGAFQPSLGPT